MEGVNKLITLDRAVVISGGSRILTRDRRGLSGSVMTSPVSHVSMFNIFAAGPLGISYSHQFK